MLTIHYIPLSYYSCTSMSRAHSFLLVVQLPLLHFITSNTVLSSVSIPSASNDVTTNALTIFTHKPLIHILLSTHPHGCIPGGLHKSPSRVQSTGDGSLGSNNTLSILGTKGTKFSSISPLHLQTIPGHITDDKNSRRA